MAETSSIDPAVLLKGGAEVTVRLFTGEQKTVLVKLLPLDDTLGRFMQFAAEDSYALADLVVGELPGWAKTVDPLGVLEINEKALELNFALARRWAELRAKLGALARELKSPPSPSASPSVSPNSSATPRS